MYRTSWPSSDHAEWKEKPQTEAREATSDHAGVSAPRLEEAQSAPEARLDCTGTKVVMGEDESRRYRLHPKTMEPASGPFTGRTV